VCLLEPAAGEEAAAEEPVVEEAKVGRTAGSLILSSITYLSTSYIFISAVHTFQAHELAFKNGHMPSVGVVGCASRFRSGSWSNATQRGCLQFRQGVKQGVRFVASIIGCRWLDATVRGGTSLRGCMRCAVVSRSKTVSWHVHAFALFAGC